jgi:uncharacterized protein
MRYLLDVNVLIAWGWSDHVDHDLIVRWIAESKKQKRILLFTSAIPQLGFVRVSVQRASGQLTVAQASETLSGMLSSLGKLHSFIPDTEASTKFPIWCNSASRTTDAHLLRLAESNKAILVTLDKNIPGAFLLQS